jgi:hypothetical protein
LELPQPVVATGIVSPFKVFYNRSSEEKRKTELGLLSGSQGMCYNRFMKKEELF